MCGVNGDARRQDATHPKLAKRLTLAGLAFLGLCTVSIPVTLALVLGGPQPRHAAAPVALAAVRCVPERGYYALAFDGGPFGRTTRRLVATLKKTGAVATFFDVGARAAAGPGLVELQRSAGQVVNHSWNHPRMSLDSRIRRAGLTPVYGTVDAQDTSRSVATLVAYALKVKPEGVILFHDGVDRTVDAIPRIVAGLEKRGMCPGFLATRLVVGQNGLAFHVIAVKP